MEELFWQVEELRAEMSIREDEREKYRSVTETLQLEKLHTPSAE